MATRRNPKENDISLPFAALRLLAPPVRLMSAALWKVMKQRDVMQYGVVEEFVTSACETVPGLLTVRHQGKLALGLRARLILELCCTQPDEKLIMQHLERIRPPAGLSASSGPAVKRDIKILRTVENFRSLVHTLLTVPAERELFFKEEFPVDYGPKFDQELEKLLWEFLIRMDQLLPIPNLAQTVSWLSDSPIVRIECARAASQPQILDVLLQHETYLGHLAPAASLPPNMGDSILDSLSLPPSGRVSSNKQTGDKKSAVDLSTGAQTRDKTPFITPVIGLISNEDVPAMNSSNKSTLRSDDVTNENLKFTVVKRKQNPKDDGVEEESNASKGSSRMKRKQPDESESDEEEEVLRMITSGKKRISKSLRNGSGMFSQVGGDQRTNKSEDDQAKTSGNERNRAVLETRMTQLGVKTLRLPEDPSLCSIFVSCLSSQPQVVLEKLSVTSASQALHTRRKSKPVKAPTQKSTSNQLQKSDLDFHGLDDKENHALLQSVSSSPSQQRSDAETGLPGDGEDYVADSEDEATKNFKGRLFMKRYYKTKHGTYVPTLREYWKPGMTRRELSSTGSKQMMKRSFTGKFGIR